LAKIVSHGWRASSWRQGDKGGEGREKDEILKTREPGGVSSFPIKRLKERAEGRKHLASCSNGVITALEGKVFFGHRASLKGTINDAYILSLSSSSFGNDVSQGKDPACA